MRRILMFTAVPVFAAAALAVPRSEKPARPVQIESAPRIVVDCRERRTPVSPYVFGVAFDPMKPDDAAPWDSRPTIRRFGGNPASRFNPKLGAAWNTGSDWFFENVNYTGKKDWTIRRLFDDDRKHGAVTSLTVPMLGWVAKDTTSSSFPQERYGAQMATDPWRAGAGNGVTPDGKPLPPPPPSSTSVPHGPEDVAAWLRELRAKDRGARSVALVHLDNEPDLWHETHRDVHPSPVGYDELMTRTLATARAIRIADPDAVVAGPASWGWTGYFYSAQDVAFGRGFRIVRPDRRAHGDVPMLAWYLQSVVDAERASGTRLVDALDVHFYPQGEGLYGGVERVDDEAARRRVRATRALWDPTYVDESWIQEPVALVPRLQRLVDENAPGKKIVIGEYSFGAMEHVSGGVAQAEALGRFATSGIWAAFLWTYPPAGSPGARAFRAYRDYDGRGGVFKDAALPAQDVGELSVFPSIDDDGLVIVLVNRSFDVARDPVIEVSGCGDVASQRAYVDGVEGPLHVDAPGVAVVEVKFAR